MVFGFAITAYFNFGGQDSHFKSVQDALLNCIYMLVTQLDITQYQTSQLASLMVWIIIYMVNFKPFWFRTKRQIT